MIAPSKAPDAPRAERARFRSIGVALAAALAVAGPRVFAGPAPGASAAADATPAPLRASASAPGAAAAPAATSAPSPGGGAQGSVSVEPQRARIGDPIRVTVSYPAPGVWKAAPGDELKPGEKLGAFRILATDAGAPGVFHVTLGADETGDLGTPALQITFKDAGGVSVNVAVPSVKISVASVLADGDSTALADLKPPAELPVPWPWATLALLGAGLAAAAAATWWISRWLRRDRAPRLVPEIALPPGVTAEEWAREELARLVASGLLAEGRHHECHIAMADLVRRYVELRFRLPAMERTTEEIADEIPRALVDDALARLTVGVLARCDRVKFAKYVPPAEEVQDTLARIKEMLDRGAPAPATASAPSAKDPAEPLPASGTAA